MEVSEKRWLEGILLYRELMMVMMTIFYTN
jgi:hypothetical protein